jgi:ABC-type transporter Mla subunit MlaD
MGTDDDIADLRRRVDALEEHAALADTKTFQRVVLRQLNAVGQTLSEHSRTLHDITTVLVRMEARLDGHDEAFARNDAAIARHDEILARHDEAFARNDAAIARHDGALSRHDGALSRHAGMLADILAAVRPGGPSAPGAQPG